MCGSIISIPTILTGQSSLEFNSKFRFNGNGRLEKNPGVNWHTCGRSKFVELACELRCVTPDEVGLLEHDSAVAGEEAQGGEGLVVGRESRAHGEGEKPHAQHHVRPAPANAATNKPNQSIIESSSGKTRETRENKEKTRG